MSCEAELAYLREAFNEAATNLAGWNYDVNARNRSGEYLHPFGKLYERIFDTQGGLTMLAELQCLRDRIDALEA